MTTRDGQGGLDSPKTTKGKRPETLEEALHLLNDAKIQHAASNRRLSDARSNVSRFHTSEDIALPKPQKQHEHTGRAGKIDDMQPLPWHHTENLKTIGLCLLFLFLVCSGVAYWLPF